MRYCFDFAEISAKSDLHHLFAIAGNGCAADAGLRGHFFVQIL